MSYAAYSKDGDGIATITFNRPKALNAINSTVLDELSAALDAIAADEDIRVLVVDSEQAYAWLREGKIRSSATIIALQWLQLLKEKILTSG